MNTRILTVSGVTPYSDKKGRLVEVPLIRLQGKWLEVMGFKVGSKVKVCENGKTIIIILKD